MPEKQTPAFFVVGGSARQLVPDQLLVDLANAGFRNVFHEVNLSGNGPLVDVATVHKLLQVLLDVFQPDVLVLSPSLRLSG